MPPPVPRTRAEVERTMRARELGKPLPAFRLDDDKATPSYTNDVSIPPSGADCSVTNCRRPASHRITFGQTNGVSDYCSHHAWPFTRATTYD